MIVAVNCRTKERRVFRTNQTFAAWAMSHAIGPDLIDVRIVPLDLVPTPETTEPKDHR